MLTNKQDESIMLLLPIVSVVTLPSRVSVLVGKVKVPVLLIWEMIGVIKVLLVRVSEPVRLTREQS